MPTNPNLFVAFRPRHAGVCCDMLQFVAKMKKMKPMTASRPKESHQLFANVRLSSLALARNHPARGGSWRSFQPPSASFNLGRTHGYTAAKPEGGNETDH
jgi:hypothetical protein